MADLICIDSLFRMSGPAFDRLVARRFRAQLIPHQQYGAQGDRRIGYVKCRPVVACRVPLDEIDDGAEADPVDDVAELRKMT